MHAPEILLKTLVERHIADGQPVGSRALSRYLRSRAVAGDGAQCDERPRGDAGFIASPHTSAGRIPTARGYRFFVDSLLTVQPLERARVRALEGQLQSPPAAAPDQLAPRTCSPNSPSLPASSWRRARLRGAHPPDRVRQSWPKIASC
jgi:hypothetical protein